MDGTVRMAIAGKVDDGILMVFGEQYFDQGVVGNVGLHKDVPEVAHLGEHVKVDDILIKI
jgi:hypothetical protein